MNARYDSQLTAPPAITPQMRANALQGLANAPQHAQYGSQYGDVLRSLGGQAAGQINRAADMSNYAFDSNLAQRQRQLASLGLQGLIDAESRQQQLQTARLDNMRGALGALM